jgi:glycosyltransferase 2 family protein
LLRIKLLVMRFFPSLFNSEIMKQAITLVLKAAISALLLYFALRTVDFELLYQRLGRLDVAWAGAALLVLGLQIFLVALRWQRIAKTCDVPLGGRDAMFFTFIGTFFNQTLPSTVGGDAVRIWLLARKNGEWKNSAYSVLLDRIVGLIWLALIVLVCLPWSLQLIENRVGRVTLTLIGVGGLAGPAALFALTHVTKSVLMRWRISRHLYDAAQLLWQVLVPLKTGGIIALISILVHLMTVLVAWLIAKAVGAQFGIYYSLLLIPPVILIAAIPVSLAGWGVRESAMIAAFTYAGLSQTDGLTISVLFGLGQFVIGVLGGAVWILSGRRSPSKSSTTHAGLS